MRGNVFSIQHFSTEDGPGIRTTVFLKGCPLDCAWCHNPESKKSGTEIAYNVRKCIACGACASVCSEGCHRVESGIHTFRRNGCTSCLKCIDVCPGALETTGRLVEAEAVFDAIKGDKPFYGETGGVTLSGGEPLMQPDFSEELLRLCREANIHTCVETSGYAAWFVLERVARRTQLFLFDWKLGDDAAHIRYTGQSNQRIRENLIRLADTGAQIVLRCPLIPDINDTIEHFRSIAEMADTAKVRRIDLMPYHDIYTGKASAYGMAPLRKFRVPDSEEIARWTASIGQFTNIPVIRG